MKLYASRRTGRVYRISTRRGDTLHLVEVGPNGEGQDGAEKRTVKASNLSKSYARHVPLPEIPFTTDHPEDTPESALERLAKRPQLQEDEGRALYQSQTPRDTYGPDPSAPLSAFVTSTTGTNAPPTSGDAHGHPSRPSEDAARQLSASPSPEEPFWTWPYVLAVVAAGIAVVLLTLYAVGQ